LWQSHRVRGTPGRRVISTLAGSRAFRHPSINLIESPFVQNALLTRSGPPPRTRKHATIAQSPNLLLPRIAVRIEKFCPAGSFGWNPLADLWEIADRSPLRAFCVNMGNAASRQAKPILDPCLIHGRPTSRPRSRPRVVQEWSDPSRDGSLSSRPAGRAKGRRQKDGPRTNSRYRCCG
jgi:hypothetical protein